MAGAGSLLAAASARAGSRRRVVVIGAGLAGLAAADVLHRAGIDVVVLEARHRVGGRVHTLRGFAAGQVAEAGGEYLDTDHVVMRGLVRRFGLRLDDLTQAGSDQPGCVYLNGRRSTESSLYTSKVNSEIDRFYTALSRLSRALDPNDPVADGASLDRHSAADFLDSLNLDPQARLAIEHDIIRDDYNVESKDLSLLFLAQGDSLPAGQAERFRVHGGNHQIPAALRRTLGSRVKLSTPVTAVAQDAHSVTLTAAGRRFRADACILAAPLPALRSVGFSPALPAAVAGAIAHLQYGTGAKVALQYASRPWIAQGFDGDTFTDLAISTTWDATAAQPGPQGILLVYTVGRPGSYSVALTDAQRIAAAAADLELIYPGSRGSLGAARTVAWTDEMYTRGTYTAYAPGQVVAYWRALRRPFGRIILAGEHTDAFTGYMEGAARSGIRAAGRVRQILR